MTNSNAPFVDQVFWNFLDWVSAESSESRSSKTEWLLYNESENGPLQGAPYQYRKLGLVEVV
ncbi:hypothetical protein VP1G_10734 [Cytospora mali]|uniref:Uncharacterized protein n=1 Tax=Cytospora mali TaxID=578113 RepID=A0A194UVI2_CYTMA|nr:hypothetical protein VP1G_10734 [Valsa mali var. pyri (nom. inval.)]